MILGETQQDNSKQHSILGILTGFTWLSVLIVLSAITVSYFVSRNIARQQAWEKARYAIFETAENASDLLVELKSGSELLANQTDIIDFCTASAVQRHSARDTVLSLLTSYANFKNEVLDVYLVTADGASISAQPEDVDANAISAFIAHAQIVYDYQPQRAFRSAILTDLYQGNDGRKYFALLYPIYRPIAAPKENDYLGSLITICDSKTLLSLAEVNSNTIVVLYNGSPVEMQWLGNTKAIIEAYLGGQAVGGATCDVLFGNVNPCGRLPESFPIKLEDTPSYISYGGEGDIAIYNEGIFVGYRYYDKKKMSVLFTFGYGLSYTTFDYDNLHVSAESIKDIDTLTVTVDVTNTGKTAGKEVVQLYVSDCDSTVFRPLRELKGFEKIFLTPGETKTVIFTLDKRSFAYWNVNLKDWHVETGVFNIEIGRNSRDIVLRKSVFVASTVILPVHITVDTLYADIIDNSKAVEALSPALDAMMRNLSGGGSSVASSAISYKMAQAIIRYMPLRALIRETLINDLNKNPDWKYFCFFEPVTAKT